LTAVKFRAEWLLPVSDAPIRDACVVIEDGRIAAVSSNPALGIDTDAIDLGRVVVMPALVNAHTHLELSYLQGRVPPGPQFLDWIRALMAARREYSDPAAPAIVDAARRAIAQARAAGTGLFGDVSNTLVTVPLLREAGAAAQVFYELLGFSGVDPGKQAAAARTKIREIGGDAGATDAVRISLAAHAPYSVSPGLFAAIRTDIDEHPAQPSTVHLGESPEEVEFLRKGSGGWRTLLEELGAWNQEWRVPGVSPVSYLTDLGFLDRCVLAVHGVQFDGEDLGHLAALGVTVVSCPRSNSHVGVGSPPIEAFYAMDVDVAFGTDSLASVPDLNVFAELAEARRLAPRVRARRLIESATLAGARALGFERDYGSIEAGKQAQLIAVRVPEGITDVEEFLVSGIEPSTIEWLLEP
jgi:cytosine/adenosine deaminase-related metal-dependent hydrolase